MNLEIVCPHCGSIRVVKKNDSQKTITCNFCGSSLSDIAREFIFNTQEEKSKNLLQQNVKPPTYQNMPSFPVSQKFQKSKSRNLQHRQFPFGFKAKSAPTKPSSKNAVFLYFPQINQKVLIPSNVSVFHFGRNTILPLVNPNEFDVEWLNSISRIKKQNRKIIKEHFSITRDRSGKFFIEDLQSRWGTWLNRQQIKGRGQIPLLSGDKIELILSKPNIKNVFPFLINFVSQ